MQEDTGPERNELRAIIVLNTKFANQLRKMDDLSGNSAVSRSFGIGGLGIERMSVSRTRGEGGWYQGICIGASVL